MGRHRRRRGMLRPVLTTLAVVTLLLTALSTVTWEFAGQQRPVAEARTLLQALAEPPPQSPARYVAPLVEQRAARAARPSTSSPSVTRPGQRVRPKIKPAAGLTAADAAAGLMDQQVIQHLSGRFDVVPGSAKAPGRGTVHTVRVELEHGLNVDAQKFAAFVLATLNDRHSWGAGGRMTFARTDGRADFRVLLASPDTTARLCLPLRTGGRLSCRTGDKAVLTMYRWVRAVPDYGPDRTGYRHYLVNHEVGHWLGHGHVGCPGRGRRAPVMMQQTKGLRGCTPNPWPHP